MTDTKVNKVANLERGLFQHNEIYKTLFQTPAGMASLFKFIVTNAPQDKPEIPESVAKINDLYT